MQSWSEKTAVCIITDMTHIYAPKLHVQELSKLHAKWPRITNRMIRLNQADIDFTVEQACEYTLTVKEEHFIFFI